MAEENLPKRRRIIVEEDEEEDGISVFNALQ